ncbi:MAG: Stp1/IreP family PP2C-type Ser/Thr phosphatase [Solirubrobacteraceae bacterium]
MLRVVEQYSGTDTGRQRRANEDSLLARAPLFVVADGMGGAQAGEVASRIAVDSFSDAVPDDAGDHERALGELIAQANARIHALSRANVEQAGMGTTLTAVYVGADGVSLAHVGDSRAYRLRDGLLARLTEDHSLVDELLRQGRLTPAEAQEHPQRSVITRALGPEPVVQADTSTHPAQAGDVYLVCSDGLTSMLPDDALAEIINGAKDLSSAGEALLNAANEAGGRDNITVILFRLEEVGGPNDHAGVIIGADAGTPAPQGAPAAAPEARQDDAASTVARASNGAVRRAVPRRPRAAASPSGARARRRLRPRVAPLVALAVLGLVVAAGYLATQSVYFIGTNARGFVTVYNGLPYSLPGGVHLYSQYYVTGVPATTVAVPRRQRLLDNSWQSSSKAAEVARSLELETLPPQ